LRLSWSWLCYRLSWGYLLSSSSHGLSWLLSRSLACQCGRISWSSKGLLSNRSRYWHLSSLSWLWFLNLSRRSQGCTELLDRQGFSELFDRRRLLFQNLELVCLHGFFSWLRSRRSHWGRRCHSLRSRSGGCSRGCSRRCLSSS